MSEKKRWFDESVHERAKVGKWEIRVKAGIDNFSLCAHDLTIWAPSSAWCNVPCEISMTGNRHQMIDQLIELHSFLGKALEKLKT